MIVQVGIAVVIAVVAGIVALVLSRRTRPDEPTEPDGYEIPTVLDRHDFDRPDAPWLVVAFSSATCLSCADAWEKVKQLESTDVAVQDVEAVSHKDLHDRYRIEAVPMIVVADDEGAVRASFLGVPSAADLWSALAELRAPG